MVMRDSLRWRSGRVAVVGALVAALLVVGLAGADAQAPYGPYESDPIVGGGTDGTLWTTEVVGDQVWVGGTFGNVRNHFSVGEPDVPSVNLGVIDMNTGMIREDRLFDVNGPVFAIELVEDRVWIGGDFSEVNGESRTRLAAFDAFSGALLPEAPSADDTIRDLVFHDGWLYVGGEQDNLGGASVESAARMDPFTGAVDATWQPPSVSGWVSSIATHGDLIAISNHLSANTRVYSISDPDAGNSRLNAGGVVATAFSPDGSRIFVGNRSNLLYGFVTSEADLNGDTVSPDWTRSGAGGDIQAIEATDTSVWFGLHESFQGNNSVKLASVDPASGSVQSWYAEIDSYWGVEDIQAVEQGLIVTGYFENVNGIEARRFAFFPASGEVAPAQPLRPDGDVSCDDSVDVVDSLLIVQYLVGSRDGVASCPLPDPDGGLRVNRADVNIDGTVSIVDALLIAQCDAGIVNVACL